MYCTHGPVTIKRGWQLVNACPSINTEVKVGGIEEVVAVMVVVVVVQQEQDPHSK